MRQQSLADDFEKHYRNEATSGRDGSDHPLVAFFRRYSHSLPEPNKVLVEGLLA
jgi:hypothetical protein